MPRRTLSLFPNENEAIDFCVKDFYALARQAIVERGIFTVALSGGSTPKNLYKALASSPLATSIDWNRVCLFWSDERAVPPDDPESNWGMAMQFFSKPPLALAQKFRMEADADSLDAAAVRYEKQIMSSCPEQRLDLIYLGMGDDGHTASLFPNTAALQEKKRLVVANFIPEKGVWRMTLTFPCINNARHIVILVFGEKKAAVLQEVFNKPGVYPISEVGTNEVPALFVCDKAAAHL